MQLILRISKIKLGGINLIWHNGLETNIQTYSLTVSYGSVSQVIHLNESYYHFTAPEVAPPCQVYNFSVTATYVGATYTGAGCSVPSPVFSTMLPSVPDITRLESSVKYSLKRNLSGGVLLKVMFMVGYY